MSLRYYPPLQEDFIELDGMVIPVERKTHRTPIVIILPLAVNMLIYDLPPAQPGALPGPRALRYT